MYSVFAKLLEERGVSAAQVSKATGIRDGVLSDWKNGKYNLKVDKLRLIADYFGVPLEYMLTGEYPEQDKKVYYFTEETVAAAQELLDNKDLHALMKAARGCPADVIRSTAELLSKFKETNHDG